MKKLTCKEILKRISKGDFIDYDLECDAKSLSNNEIEELIQSGNLKCILWVSEFCELDEKLIEKYNSVISFPIISATQKLSIKFIDKYKNILDMHMICRNQKLTYNFIERNKELIDFYKLSFNKVMTKLEFELTIARNYNNSDISWIAISRRDDLEESFILKFKEKLDPIMMYGSISDKILQNVYGPTYLLNLKDKIKSFQVVPYYLEHVVEEKIEKHLKINWKYLNGFQLSNTFVDKYHCYLNK